MAKGKKVLPTRSYPSGIVSFDKNKFPIITTRDEEETKVIFDFPFTVDGSNVSNDIGRKFNDKLINMTWLTLPADLQEIDRTKFAELWKQLAMELDIQIETCEEEFDEEVLAVIDYLFNQLLIQCKCYINNKV